VGPWFVVSDLLTDPPLDINIFENIDRMPYIGAHRGLRDASGFSLHAFSVSQQAVNYMLFR
jgi:ribosomal protein S13